MISFSYKALAALALAAAFALPACSRPLPEEQSEAGVLYSSRCGGCHLPYHPGLMTAAMWRSMVERMETGPMRRSGLKLVAPERDSIIAYLVRNAGEN